MNTTFEFNKLPDHERVAYFGSMFAVASCDGEIAKEELALIFESIDQEGLSEAAKSTLRSYLVDPPKLNDCLDVLANGSDELRYGTMVALCDIAMADDVLEPEEKAALKEAQQRLRVSEPQMAAIETFVAAARKIRERGIDDNVAAEGLKKAASGLTAVGIPIAAVYFSGSVIGLSAAGITSGLAALGLGFGMVPGIGVAIVLGVAAFYGTSWLLGIGKAKRKAVHQAERERRAQLVIRNLQDAVNDLVARIANLRDAAEQARKNQEGIDALNQRLRALQQLLARRKAAAAEAQA